MPNVDTPADTLFIRPPTEESDREAVIDLAAKVFSHRYYDMREYCRKEYMTPDVYDAYASRVGVINGKIVCHWGVWRQMMRIGSVHLSVAGIGVVSTDADYRKRGYLRRVATEAIAAFPSQGFDVTMLFGIPNFYHRFGYVPAFTEVSYTVSINEFSPSPPSPTAEEVLEKGSIQMRAALDALYNSFAQQYQISGMAKRPFLPLRPPGVQNAESRAKMPDGWYVLRETDGTISGYAAVEFTYGKVTVLEAIGEPARLFSLIGALAKNEKANEVVFATLSPFTPMARFLRKKTVQETFHYRTNQGALGRTVNLCGTLEKLAPELTQRILSNMPHCPAGPIVTLADPREECTIIWDGSRVAIRAGTCDSSVPLVQAGERTFRLLVGAASAEEIMSEAGVAGSPELWSIVAALFPVRHPIVPRMDMY